MHLPQDPQFGDKLITLMAALMLVVQLAMAPAHVVTNIRLFAIQSVLLAAIAGTVAWYNGAARLCGRRADAARQGDFPSLLLNRLVHRIEIQQEIEPLLNAPLSV